jgi:hypothetical protein
MRSEESCNDFTSSHALLRLVIEESATKLRRYDVYVQIHPESTKRNYSSQYIDRINAQQNAAFLHGIVDIDPQALSSL